MELEKRTCKVCGIENYKIIDFMLKNYPNTCKKCVAKSAKINHEKHHGKSTGFDWGRQKIIGPKSG